MNGNHVDFDTALPRLAAAYHDGVLVPFLGAGMSRDACVDWRDMLSQLRQELDAGLPEETNLRIAQCGPSSLYRIADELVTSVEVEPWSRRADIYRRAITNPKGNSAPTRQSEALAEVFWPLVISTNYDDVYWAAAAKAGAEIMHMPPPTILGRSRYDCHRVLACLDTYVDPMLWTIQGFVGGPVLKPAHAVPDERQRERLVHEVVVGHRQYQRAINDFPHFRRAFAEVYRRRSLWFLGSGITEDYLINLLSEIRHHHGPSPHPHFACLKRDELPDEDLRFLATRLGILPVMFSSYEDLPGKLSDFAASVKRGPGLRSMCFVANKDLDIEITTTRVPVVTGEASVVSLGRDADNRPILGGMADGAVGNLLAQEAAQASWTALDDAPSAAFRYGDTQLFGIAARSPGDDRDLGVIADAVERGLKYASEFPVIHMGAIASGPDRLWHPVHPFAQMLRGVRAFWHGKAGCVRRVVLHMVDWRLRLALRAGLIPVSELLFSDLLLHRVEVMAAEGDSEAFSVRLDGDATVGKLLAACGLDGEWRRDVEPKLSQQDGLVGDEVTLPSTAVLRLRR